jgi:SAM-dependent methyltransferase
VDYDAELRRYDAVLRRAAAVRPGERVLDVGCGTGSTTRAAARSGAHALGVDVSEKAIARARELSAGIPNVAFERADAQTADLGEHDLVVSRFGTMFFADPAAAFANLHRALRPGGRLVMLVWQAADRNEWATALGTTDAGPDPFSLAEPVAVVEAAGFDGVMLTDVHEPVHYGADVEEAFAWVSGFSCVPQPIDETRLREHLTADGVTFDARAWLVTARR